MQNFVIIMAKKESTEVDLEPEPVAADAVLDPQPLHTYSLRTRQGQQTHISR